MEHPSHILPSNFPSDLSLEDSSLSRRLPLTDSAGNSQSQALASIGFYHDGKGSTQGIERPMCIPTLPSQPSRQHLGITLEQRKQSHRRRRRQPVDRIPVTSPPYQSYRDRASREGNDEQKWPAILEDAFLNALIEMPTMKRRKYSYKGKPHGRNELIAEYLWIAYLQTLKPGERPDPTMRRDRKQVSSHIQVIKALFKGYPGYTVLFPPKTEPKNGFEDSFKDNPCLIAISEGRLPNNRFEYDAGNDFSLPDESPIRPTHFWLLITTQPVPDEADGAFNTEEDLQNAGIVAHKFSGLSSQRSRAPLDSILNWQRRFPMLERLRMTGDLSCDIIHMSVSLNLMAEHPREGSELCCRTELSIPGRQTNCEWRIVTTFVKPPGLYSNPMEDPPLEGVEFQVGIISSNDVETRIKVPFPAKAWANAFTQLINIQSRYEEKRRAQSLGRDTGPAKSAREYVDELTMYQEIRSSNGPRSPFIRRAIILWTFHKSRQGEDSVTDWRYIDHLPPRRACMSPPPHQNHQISAAMNETYNTWNEPAIPLLDPFHIPYSQSFSYSNLPFDLPNGNMSFKAVETEPLEDPSHIDHYLSQNTNLTDFETPTTNWLPTTTFDDTWASYTTAAPNIWDDKTQWPNDEPKTWESRGEWPATPSKRSDFDHTIPPWSGPLE